MILVVTVYFSFNWRRASIEVSFLLSNMAAYEPPDFFEFEVSPDLYTPSTPPPSNASGLPSPLMLVSFSHVNDPAIPAIEHLKTALVAAAVLSFFFFIAKDAHKAFTRRAHWIPCDFLVLSAFSIQMLNILNTQNQAVKTSSQTGHWLSTNKAELSTSAGQQYAGWKDILMIHNSRTILCLFTAYVMPAMADGGLEHAWVRWVALVITAFHHLTSEYYSVKGEASVKDNSMSASNFLRLWPQANIMRSPRAPYYAYATIISLCFILLNLLLACATIAGRSIERIVSKKISLVLRGQGEFSDGLADETHEKAHPQHHSCWRNVKIDAVNRADQHYHLHHVHNHSCLQTVEEARVLRAGKEDGNHHHSCWQTVEDAVLREEKEEGNHHSCCQTIQGTPARGEEEQYRRHCHYCWRRVEDAVLKAWIIVRAYSVQPVLARSALSASAAIIVTVQIVITIVGGLTNVLQKDIEAGSNKFKLVAIIVQSMFILMAWALINLRWATAVAYHRRHKNDRWRSGLKMEDFWTRHLKELEQAGESPLEEAQSLDKEIERLVSKKQMTPALPGMFWSALIGMQWLLVSFSKACWFVSLMIFHNKLMLKLFRFMFEKHIMYVFEDYPKYEKILEEVQMLGESPESLWVSNRKSIEQAKMLSIQGNQDGECSCDDLVEFLIHKRTPKGLGLSCLEPHKPQTGLNFLCNKKKPIQMTRQQPQEERDVEKQVPTVEEQFTDMSTKSWKMTAVSLLGIIVHLSAFNAESNQEHCSSSDTSPWDIAKNCLKVYSQAWEIIDLVEEADAEADGITSEAADKYFQALQEKVSKADSSQKNLRPATSKCVCETFDELKKEARELQHLNPCKEGKKHRRCEGNDSIDWKAAAWGSALYYLCDSIECNDGTEVTDLQNELESSLADVINECLEKTQNLLLLNSRKWALKRDEERMGKALYTAGKAKAIMEKLAFNKLAIVSYH